MAVISKKNTFSRFSNRPVEPLRRLPVPAFLLWITLIAGMGCRHFVSTHDYASRKLLTLSQNLDAFMAEPHEDNEYRESRVTLSAGAVIDRDGEARFSARNKMKIALPGLKDRIGLMIGGASDAESDEARDLADSDVQDYESFLRVFSRAPRKWLDWDFDIGLKFDPDVKMFTRFTGIRSGWWNETEYRYVQRFFWRNYEGFGLQGRFELDQQLTDKTLLREFIDLKHTEITSGVDVSGGVYLRAMPFQGLAWSLELMHFGTTHPWIYRYTDFSTRIRKSIGYRWLEFEMRPVIRFRRQDDRLKMEPYVEFFINMTFDARHLKTEN